MSIDQFIDALDDYLTKADLSVDDPAKEGSRERLINQLSEVLRSQDRHLGSAAEDHLTSKIKGIRKNPLNKFLDSVAPLTKIAWSAAAHKQITPVQHEAFVANEEDRNYATDLVTRVELLSHAFDKLCELGIEHFEISEEMKRNQPSPQGINLSLVPPSVLSREEHWSKEVDVVTAFAHYEIKSVADMLKQWGIKVNTRELRYIAKSRDRFLAHPQQGGVMRMARRSLSIPFDGGPVKASVAGLNQWGPITRDYYLDQLNLSSPPDHSRERLENEEILLSSKRNHQLSKGEIVRLKAFGLRDPDLLKALDELSKLLEEYAVPRIETTFEIAVKDFGFERFS